MLHYVYINYNRKCHIHNLDLGGNTAHPSISTSAPNANDEHPTVIIEGTGKFLEWKNST